MKHTHESLRSWNEKYKRKAFGYFSSESNPRRSSHVIRLRRQFCIMQRGISSMFSYHVSTITSPDVASQFAYALKHLLSNKPEVYNVRGTRQGQVPK